MIFEPDDKSLAIWYNTADVPAAVLVRSDSYTPSTHPLERWYVADIHFTAEPQNYQAFTWEEAYENLTARYGEPVIVADPRKGIA